MRASVSYPLFAATTVDSDEDLMPLERELATAEHDLASPPAVHANI